MQVQQLSSMSVYELQTGPVCTGRGQQVGIFIHPADLVKFRLAVRWAVEAGEDLRCPLLGDKEALRDLYELRDLLEHY